MVSGLFHIKLNSDEDNKDNGLYALMTSGASIICLKDEEYVVPENAVAKLNEKKIKYEVVVKKDTSTKKCENKDGTSIKI